MRKDDTNEYILMQNKDERTLETSSSGGVIPEIINYVMANGGDCYGAAFRSDFLGLEYVKVTFQNMMLVRGSKYLSVSLTPDIILQIENSLKSGNLTLFIGRPCQCNFIRQRFKSYNNLLIVGILCHGVPTNMDKWVQFIESLKKQYGEIQSISFRDKRIGWVNYQFTIKFQSGFVLSMKSQKNPIMMDYITNKSINKACLSCPFGVSKSIGTDILCGDAWGAKKFIQDNRGLSLVISQTKFGKFVLDQIKSKFIVNRVSFDYAYQLKQFNSGLRVLIK